MTRAERLRALLRLERLHLEARALSAPAEAIPVIQALLDAVDARLHDLAQVERLAQ